MKKVLIGMLLLVVVLSFAACKSADSELITKDEFEQIETGMSYDEVCDIIGSEGDLVAENSFAGYETSIYTWKGYGSMGANANITFQNDEVFTKAQAGLK